MKRNQSPKLNREMIIEHGLKLAGQQGIQNITLRKLADRLDVTPMALYRHFANKDELLGEMLDTFIKQADVLPGQPLPWQQWLVSLAVNMYDALKTEPSWIPVFPSISLKPAAIQVMQHSIDKLLTAGFSSAQAASAFAAMMHSLLGAVIMHNNEQGADSRQAFEQSINLLVKGLEQLKSR